MKLTINRVLFRFNTQKVESDRTTKKKETHAFKFNNLCPIFAIGLVFCKVKC